MNILLRQFRIDWRWQLECNLHFVIIQIFEK